MRIAALIVGIVGGTFGLLSAILGLLWAASGVRWKRRVQALL
jgi:hypothetical protein